MKYITIRNWEKWQSYRSDRGQPPWIKLHRRLMSDPHWVALTNEQRGQLVAIWMLAAERNGRIPAEKNVIKKLCHMDNFSEMDIKVLIKHEFLDAKLTPRRRQVDAKLASQNRIETDKNREDKDIEKTGGMQPPLNCVPYEKIIDLWAQELPELPRPIKLTPARKSRIRARWNDELPDLDAWRECFGHIRKSRFMMGKVDPPPNRKRFLCTLDWITKQENLIKLYEGNYDG